MVEAGAIGLTFADASLSSGLAILAGAMAAGAVLLFMLGLQRVVAGRPSSVARRLDDFVGAAPVPLPESAAATATAGRRTRRAQRSRAPGANASGLSLRIARELAQADVKITAGEFLMLSAVLASVGALIGFALPLGGHVLLGLILLPVGWYAPRFWLNRQRTRRMTAFNSQLADVIGMMAGALRSGYSLQQAMDLAAHEGPSPSGPEFERVVREVGLGLSPEEALNNLVRRMESEELVLMVTALNVQREVGGNLVEVLETIANTIRERTKLVAEVKVLTAQQQYSGYIIALLPVGLALMLAVINPTYMLGVFKDTTWCGWTMVGCSGIMIFSGFMIIRRIVNIKV